MKAGKMRISPLFLYPKGVSLVIMPAEKALNCNRKRRHMICQKLQIRPNSDAGT